MSPLGAAALGPLRHHPGGGGEVEVPTQPTTLESVGVVNPYGVTGETPFVQSVAVPLSKNVPKGVYGVRVGDRQLAAQATSVKHRPNGNARLLRVEGLWPSDLTTSQTISLTALPPAVTPEVTVDLNGGNVRVFRNGSLAHTIAPYAATAQISGSKPSNLKGSNSDTSPTGYIPRESFHEWHITRVGSQTSVGAAFEDLTVEEDTPALRTYLATGKGSVDSLYQFQLRMTIIKAKPWIRWEFTTFKHMDVNLPGETGAKPALSAERLTITPSSAFTGARIKSATGSSLTLEASPTGTVSGSLSGGPDDPGLNAVRLTGPQPLSAAVVDLMGYGPSAIRATTASLVLDFWSQHTTEVFDVRGTGTSGEVQADSSDYNSSPRGNARTWLGFFALEDNLVLAQRMAARDDLWFATPEQLEAGECFGPFKAAIATTFAPWFKRVNYFARVGELAAQRHSHYGYAQYGLVPSFIPESTNPSEDKYVAKEPMHSGRYGQSKDSYGGTGSLLCGLLLGDRVRTLRALRASLLHCDINGVHAVIYGSDYAGSSVNGVHRRYRDPWTGISSDPQYYYPESQFTAYWVGGARRHVERAMKMAAALDGKSAMPYPQRVWSSAVRYQYTNAGGDLTKLNNHISADVAESNDEYPPPGGLTGTVASMFWDEFRYGHNTCPAVIEVYEATGDTAHLDALADAYAAMSWAWNGTTWDIGMSTYGQHTTPFHALAYLLLRGYDSSDVGSNAINSMQFWIGDYIAAGTMRNHNASLPSGDPDTYSWSQVLSAFNGQNEEGPGFQKRFGPMIASWLASA